MRSLKNQQGSGQLAVIVLVVVVAVLGLVAYRVHQNTADKSATTTASATETAVPSKITSKADLNKADQALDSTSIDSAINPNQLDQDISAL
jgi:Tfp pilus assembly protein PilE